MLRVIVLERYTIIERMAVGGMGEVFLARQRGVGGFARTVVIKKLLPDVEQAEEFGFDPEDVTLEDSLGYGAVMYPGDIPPEWVSSLSKNRRTSRRTSRRRR